MRFRISASIPILLLAVFLGAPLLGQPANDDCTGAIPVVVGSNFVDTSTATNSGVVTDEPACDSNPTSQCCGGNFANDVWYSYTPAMDGVVTVDTCDPAGFDTDLALYDITGLVPDCSAITAVDQVGCSGDQIGSQGPLPGCQSYNSFMVVPVVAGNSYLLRLGGFGTSDNGPQNFTFELGPPGVEECTNGTDDDLDGLIDCLDPDCGGHPSCEIQNCSDGIDNDGDGLTDCDDPECCGDPACPSPCPAIESHFTMGDEGWTTLQVAGSQNVCSTSSIQVSGPFTPDYVGTGGNPGGYISEEDTQTATTVYFSAPPIFLGNKSGYFGGALSFSLNRVVCSGATLFVAYDVAICGAGLTLRVDLPAPTAPAWNFQTVVLDASGGWTDVNGDPATDADILSVLGALDRLVINGDHCGGFPEVIGLDAVSLTSDVEVCDNGVDDSGNGLVDCEDPSCPPCPEVCDDGIDNNSNGLIDCDDPDCPGDPACPEISTIFSTGAEGWTTVTVSGSLTNLSVCGSIGGPFDPDHAITGGDPGGYISDLDSSTGSTFFFSAPEIYLGDRSAFFGGELSYSVNPIDCAGLLGVVFDVALCGGGITLRTDLVNPTPGEWNSRSVVLDSSGGWLNGSGVPASDAEIQTVLGSLDRLLICGDYCNGFDTDGLDTVILAPGLPEFVRGDSNTDGIVDIADAIFTLSALFVDGAPPLTCMDAADSNDDELVDVADVIYALSALFTGGAAPPPPHPNCGWDPTPDVLDLGCEEFPACP